MQLGDINIGFWILQTVAMGLTALILPGLRITNPLGGLAAVVALAFVNSHIWDAALFFAIPDTFSSHTLLLVAANGVIFWLIVKVLPGIESDGILSVIAAPILFTVLSLAINSYGKEIKWGDYGERALSYISGVRDELKESGKTAASETAKSGR